MAAKNTKPPPQCKAFLICDYVIRDSSTGMFSVINVHNAISHYHYPAMTLSGYCYLLLTNGIGRYLLTFEVVDLADGSVIHHKSMGWYDFDSRSVLGTIVHPLTGLLVPHEGQYDMIVLADGQEIDRQQFTAIVSKEI